MPSTIRAAIYCRLSKKGGRSVQRQEQDGRAIAADRGWQVVRVFAETVSASEFATRARDQWELLLAAVREREFDAVIVWLEDRSNRDVVKAAEFVQACRAAGVRLVIADSEVTYDFTDPEDTAKFYGEMVAAQREVARLSKRVRRARVQEASEGRRHPGGLRAFGERGIGPKGNGRNVVSEAQAERERELIRQAAARILAGDSLRGIVLDWNGPPGEPQRVAPANGGRWTTQRLRKLLCSPRLAGLRDHRGQLHPGNFPAILPREQWEAVVAVLTDPARKRMGVGGTPRHLLTGLVFCGVCGARMRAQRDRHGAWAYRCPPRSDGGRSCAGRRAEQVERLIEGALFAAVESPAWDEQAAELPADDPARPHHERLAALMAELDVLDRRIGEAELAEELGGKPHPSAATLRRMLAEREAERDQHRAAVVRLQRGRTVAAVPRNLRAVWEDLSLDRRRNMLKALLRLPPEGRGIVIHPQGRGRKFDPDAIEPDWRI
jgi:DNA invertase Pin-like site-specific DNA recombinase